ncbi:hypothetical protein DSL72_002100 [Monilinia vaccinii-corymbosi]|uniref:SUI1 domain-containing protein n=1 Tax=Monilinia vaccinii-corymbosi TaxID=61207 RepID=A0A8A3PBN7_9HELO|nr:hypothetical protein DSL72_002100 [Monilinia vaccinii-corymbosi]
MLSQCEYSQIENLKSFDPFADSGEVNLRSTNKIHIRAEQTRGPAKKTGDGKSKPHMVTTVAGIPDKFDKKKIVQFFKKKLASGVKVVGDEKWGEVIQAQGDCREQLREFLVAEDGLALSRHLVAVHG